MAVYKRPSGRWTARTWDAREGRQRVVGTFDTRREAKAAEAGHMGKTSLHPKTIGEVREAWLTTWGDRQGWRESTRRNNRTVTARFADVHGKRRAGDYRVSEALQWAHERPHEARYLRAMFAFARRIDATQSNPFEQLGLVRARTRDRIALTEDEVAEFAAVANRVDGQWHSSMILFAAYTGLRQGELFALRYSDVHGDEVLIERAWSSRANRFEPPKTGKPRVVVLVEPAQQALIDLPRRVGQEHVFANSRGRHWSASSYHGHFDRVRKASEHPEMVFHELRHSCATILLERGLSHADVAEVLGHTDGGKLVMSTYGHPSPALARDRVRSAFRVPIWSPSAQGSDESGVGKPFSR